MGARELITYRRRQLSCKVATRQPAVHLSLENALHILCAKISCRRLETNREYAVSAIKICP